MGRIATDQALHFSILAVSFYGWRLDVTSPAWRATEAGVDHGAPGKSRTCKLVVGFFVVVWSICLREGAVLHVIGREIGGPRKALRSRAGQHETKRKDAQKRRPDQVMP